MNTYRGKPDPPLNNENSVNRALLLHRYFSRDSYLQSLLITENNQSTIDALDDNDMLLLLIFGNSLARVAGKLLRQKRTIIQDYITLTGDNSNKIQKKGKRSDIPVLDESKVVMRNLHSINKEITTTLLMDKISAMSYHKLYSALSDYDTEIVRAIMLGTPCITRLSKRLEEYSHEVANAAEMVLSV
jgi:hypothetical protein